MKFATVNGRRHEAQPELSGTCAGCGRPMIAKCGEVRVWHWAHQRGRTCDPWWENETEWHRSWKNHFPADWQEFVQRAPDGELHIADVMTPDGWAIEFQHSYIKPEERRSRDAFYSKLIWVVDGLRRKRDRDQFLQAWERGGHVGRRDSPVRRASTDDCRLLKEWAGSPAPVFVDFGEQHLLGWILAKKPHGPAYIAPFHRTMFVGIHRQTGSQAAQDFDSFVGEIDDLIENYERILRRRR